MPPPWSKAPRTPGCPSKTIARSARLLANLRFEVGWAALDYVDPNDYLNVPVLLFHGANDTAVHYEPSRALAEARPDVATYVQTGATHVRSWQLDPADYELQVRKFLAQIVPPT